MSKKKDKKIKRLRSLPIWPSVLSLIIVETIVFALAVFLCWCTISGIAVTVMTQSEQECRSVLKVVNENYGTDTQEQLQTKINSLLETSSTLDEVIFDNGQGILGLFPDLEDQYKANTDELFEKNGVARFVDPEMEQHLYFGIRKPERKNTSDSMVYTFAITDEDGETQPYIVDFRNIFRSLKFDSINNYDLATWAGVVLLGVNVITFYKTDIPNLNICIKHIYSFTSFQLSLVAMLVVVLTIILILVTIYEVTKLVALVGERKRINILVTTDTVTGGYNKDYFLQKAEKEIARGKKNYAVVQLRLEKYRNYCTAYGVKQGENLLEEINTSLTEMLVKKEYVAHVEKSDFLLLLNYQNNETLEIRIRNMMNILRERRAGQHLTFAAGVCPVTTKNADVSLIISCAGLAVPKSVKIQDEIVWFNDSMKEEQVWERRIEDDMEKALENHEFQVYLQPKYSTKAEVLSAAEALVRWTHPVLGFISPGKFIPIFERNGFILQLDDYMLTEVAKLQAAWLEQGKQLVPISVNVSRAHFAEENLAEHICSIVDKFKVPHEYIELELTESAFCDDKAVLLTTVRKLKGFGFKVSMDDFGAGYSSLNSLKELPLDIIKLDAEFFRSVDDIERSNLIVGQTISLAKKLGMEIVAEGIETRDQVDFLAKQDCDLIQGFYFSKPLPVTEFEERAYPKEK